MKAPPRKLVDAPRVPHGTSGHGKPTGHVPEASGGSYRLDTTRRRRLSSITRAPCRKVMGVPGQRATAAR